ncbi:hypothetical protein [Geodermatophilus sp. SYSU D01119]
MTVVLVVLTVLVVAGLVLLLGGQRGGAPWTSADPPGRGGDPHRVDPTHADGRAAVNRNSWMLGGGGSGG